jgi:hypothetical protein
LAVRKDTGCTAATFAPVSVLVAAQPRQSDDPEQGRGQKQPPQEKGEGTRPRDPRGRGYGPETRAEFLTGQAVAHALQIMVDGGPPLSSFLVRKLDETFDNVATSGSIDVDFDLAD